MAKATIERLTGEPMVFTDLYVDTITGTVIGGAAPYQGGYDANTNTPDLTTPMAGILAGQTWDVTVAGTFFTATVEVGDTVTARIDSPAAETDWVILQTNLTPASIKIQYESNADTNAYDDAAVTSVATSGTHVTSDGSDHTFIDQDVTSGSSPTFDGANFTGVQSDGVKLEARKGSVGTIAIGRPVYISGYNGGGWLEVEEADASDPAKMPAIGLAAAALTNAATGLVDTSGTLEGVDTSAYTVGDELWVGNLTALVKVKPTGTNAIQKMASVARSHASLGVLTIFGAGRSNDVPNIPSNEFWLGNGTGVATPTNFDTEVSANADVVANKAHLTATGASHTYIDQSVTTTSTPTFIGVKRTVTTFTSGPQTLTSSHDLVKCTTAAFTVNLPTAVGITGKEYDIKNDAGNGVNNITVDASGTETIDGQLTRVIVPGNSLKVVSDNVGWIII